MCDPTTIMIASMAMTAAGGVMQHQQQSAVAKNQTRMHEANQKNSLTAMRDAQEATQNRQQQEGASASQQMQRRQMQMLRERGEANAAAGESGVQGNSVTRLINEIAGVSGEDISTIQQNRDWTVSDLQNQQNSNRTTAYGRMNSTSPGIGPSVLGSALQIGGGMTNDYNNYQSATS